jgi:uncharacterized protein with HEPN domain
VPKRSARQRIADIYTNIEAARRYVNGVNRERFEADDEKQQAVLHRLQNASEATTRLKADWPAEYERLERDHPEVEWQMFRDLGNRYRHGYDQIKSRPRLERSPRLHGENSNCARNGSRNAELSLCREGWRRRGTLTSRSYAFLAKVLGMA